jgi:hypothetical protein
VIIKGEREAREEKVKIWWVEKEERGGEGAPARQIGEETPWSPWNEWIWRWRCWYWYY